MQTHDGEHISKRNLYKDSFKFSRQVWKGVLHGLTIRKDVTQHLENKNTTRLSFVFVLFILEPKTNGRSHVKIFTHNLAAL